MSRQLNIGRGPGPGRGNNFGAKMTKESWTTVKRVFAYVFKSYKWSFLVVLACILVTSVTTLASTLFTKSLIDDYVTPMVQTHSHDYEPLAKALVQLAAVLVVGIACSYLNNRLMINVGQGTLLRLRKDLFEHMEQLPIKYFDQHPHGDIMSVYTNDVDTLRQMISGSIPMVFSSIITITVTFVSMVVLSVPLTLLVIIMTGVMVFVTRKLGERSARHFKVQQTSLGAMNGYVEEMLNGQKVIKTFCHEDESVEKFQQLNQQLRESGYQANKAANIVMPINGNISNLIYVLAAILGGFIALNPSFAAFSFTSLTVGTLVAFLTLIKNFTQPVSHVSQQINSVINALAGAERVFTLMDETPEQDDMASVSLVNATVLEDGTLKESRQRTGVWAWKIPQDDGTDRLVRQRGEVDFSNVDFGYVPQKQVLFDINLDTEAGQKVALVGGTGAGKTTITNLINRFYDIQGGTILYDGIDIRKIHREDLRKSLGMVLQETHLFTGTVIDNIRYGKLEATDEECMAAAKLVNAHDFIIGLANGYNTMLAADGGNLSQGERQLIAIARAAVGNPPAMILDEATSSIDTRTEKLVQTGMDHIMTGRSTFVIAHRLSTVRNSDIIVVMDHGRIIEQGTHEQLLAMKGKYYILYTGNQIA